MKLRCYCCGEPIKGSIVLVASKQPLAVDRVFVASLDHVENFDDEFTDTLVVVPMLPVCPVCGKTKVLCEAGALCPNDCELEGWCEPFTEDEASARLSELRRAYPLEETKREPPPGDTPQ